MPATTTTTTSTPLYPDAVTDEAVLDAPTPAWLTGRYAKACLRTFRRMPDEIIWAILGDDMEFGNANICLTGSAVRESVAAMVKVDALDLKLDHMTTVLNGDINEASSYELAAKLYGGTIEEWRRIFFGVIQDGGGADYHDYGMGRGDDFRARPDWVDGWNGGDGSNRSTTTPYNVGLIERAMIARMDEALTNSPR